MTDRHDDDFEDPGQTMNLSNMRKAGDDPKESGRGNGGGNNFQKTAEGFLEEMRRSVDRAIKSDFTRVEALPSERDALERAEVPVKDALTQNYAAWRRSVLLLATIVLGMHCLTSVVDYEDAETQMRVEITGQIEALKSSQNLQDGFNEFGQFLSPEQQEGFRREQQRLREQAEKEQVDAAIRVAGKDNLALFDLIQIVLILANVVGLGLLIKGLKKWTLVGVSRDWTRYGFLVMFLTPVLLNLVPMSGLFDFSHLKLPEFQAQGIQPDVVKSGMIGGMALMLLLSAFPKFIAVFAGAIRSAITVKTLVPESSTPGFALTTLAPLYALFLVLAFGTVNQFQGKMTLLIGTLCILVVPIVYMVHSQAFLKPQTRGDVEVSVVNARRSALLFNLVGFSLVGAFMFEIPTISGLTLFSLATLLVSNVLILSVVGADFMLYYIYRDYQQTRDVTGTELMESLEGKLSHFDELGLTRLRRTDHAAKP